MNAQSARSDSRMTRWLLRIVVRRVERELGRKSRNSALARGVVAAQDAAKILGGRS
jgi:hypothetical protein